MSPLRDCLQALIARHTQRVGGGRSGGFGVGHDVVVEAALALVESATAGEENEDWFATASPHAIGGKLIFCVLGHLGHDELFRRAVAVSNGCHVADFQVGEVAKNARLAVVLNVTR